MGSTMIGNLTTRVASVSNGYLCTVVVTADDGHTLGQDEIVGNTYAEALDALRTYLDAHEPGTEWA